MKLFKKMQGKITNMSIQGSIITSGLIIGLSIFLTTWVFFGGYNNRQKLFTPTPGSMNKKAQTNTLTPQQIQQIQQQRAASVNQSSSTIPSTDSTTVKPTTESLPATKTIKKKLVN